MRLEAGTRLGPYEVIAQIGVGGMGEVYRATDVKLKRQVAIKVLPDSFIDAPDRLARFQREAEVLAQLNHPNIAQIHGLEESDGVKALVMELVEGPTVAARIAQGPIPIDEALPIAKQICEALEAAHERGIIDRDLKPANIKLRPDGAVKVLDFGLAKALEPVSARSTNATASPTITSPALVTGVGVLLGTAAYMSPEQARGRAVDKRTDIWAFGCVLYEMLTGRGAFADEDVTTTLSKVLQREPDFNALPADTPARVRQVLRLCLRKPLRERVPDIGAVRLALEGGFETAERQAFELTPSAAPVAQRTRLRFLVTAAAALVAGAVIAGATFRFLARSEPVGVIRTTISTAGATALSIHGNDRDVAVTPDGSRLIYRGYNQLLVRALDQLEPTVLTGLGAPRGVFVSPDSQWVGFFDGNVALKKVAITGGPPVTLTEIDARGPRGATWGVDGSIIFATFFQETGLLRVAADGGKATVLTKPDRERGEADHLWPEFLPGAQAVLFTITPSNEGRTPEVDNNAQIAVLDLASNTYKVLIRGGSDARYVPTGHLVYHDGGTLRAVGFDLQRMEVIGTPVPVVEDVLSTSSRGANAAVAEGGTLIYVRGRPAAAAPRSMVWVDRMGGEDLVKTPMRSFVAPRLSPDAQRVALEITDDGDDIWTFDLAQSALTRQTFDPSEDESPAWSPDGEWVAYASSAGGRSTVFRRRANGEGPPEALFSAPNPVHMHVEDWTRDGRALLISRSQLPDSPQSNIAILAMDSDPTVRPLLRSKFNMEQGRVSPDGKWIAYISNESGRYEVYVQPFPSLQGRWQISANGGTEPVWSRKGDELFYRGDGSFWAVPVAERAFTAARPQRLFDDQFFVYGGFVGYDVSPDSRRFLMLKGDASNQQMSGPPQIVLVQHWFEELKRLVPGN